MDKKDQSMITFWTSRDQHEALKQRARAEDRSMSSLLRRMVDKYLAGQDNLKDTPNGNKGAD